jgi:hypothetical protein
VVGAGMNDQVSVEQDVSNGILSEHALDSTAHDLVWVALHELSHGYFLKVAHVASVVAVYFLIHLVPSDLHLGGIHYDALISHVEAVVGIPGLVLAADEYSDHLCHATERHFLGIKKVPCLPSMMDGHISRLWGLTRHYAVHVSVEQVIRHLHGLLTDVGVELHLSEFGLRHEPLGDLTRLRLLGNRVSLLVAEEGREFQGLIPRRGDRRFLEVPSRAGQDRVVLTFLVVCGEEPRVEVAHQETMPLDRRSQLEA